MSTVRRQVPGPGQESVWDYPRPPRLEPTSARLQIVLGGELLIDTVQGLRVLETSHPPTYYLPVAGFRPDSLRPAAGRSLCEWKGLARYFDLLGGDEVAARSAWGYDDPDPRYAALAGHVAVYPAAMDRCTVDGELVQPQPGGFYGGWITSAVVGPFKGEPGTQFW